MPSPNEEFETPLRFYRFGEFEVDLVEEVLRRSGEKLNINHRMFQVLLLLVERQGEIVSKDEFFEKVWGGSFVEDNNLTVTITALRKALGDDAKQARFVENIPRKGYRFVAPVDHAGAHVSSAEPEREAPVRSFRVSFGILSVSLIVILAVAVVGSKTFWPSTSSAANGIDSIAVLPFENRTADSEYLADGLTDGIVSNLSRRPGLRVIDRNSAYRYKNKVSEPLAAGRELNVRGVVTGQIEQNADVLIISAELFDLATGTSVWRQQFRRKSSDLFATQQEISQAILQNLPPAPSGQQDGQTAKRLSGDPVAYDLYLKGRYHWNKRTIADFQKSVDLFREAIDRDPTFAKAYIGLADAYTLGHFPYVNVTPEEKNAIIRGTIQKALEIDDSLGEAYASLAINKCYYDWDFAGAESDYRRAIELDPNHATAHHWYAEFLSMQGRFEESIAEYDRAISLDPLSLPIKTDKALSYYYARDYDTAIDLLNKIMELNPDYERTIESLAFVQRQKGMFNEAIDLVEKQSARQFQRGERSAESYELMKILVSNLRNGVKNSGSEGYWKADLKHGDPTPISRVVAYSKLGDADNAFKHLDKAFEDRLTGVVWLKVLPEIDGIRSDPRFRDYLRRAGFSN